MTSTPIYTNGTGTGTDDAAAQPPLYTTLEPWVSAFFTPMFLHRIGDGSRQRWCTQWWDHPEAIARLTLLWTTWETARWDPTTKAGWWLELDHHLPILLAPDGPFRACRPTLDDRPATHEPAPLPIQEIAPIGWWD